MLKPGDTFERYTVDAVIGQGGMGSVYRAHDARLDRRVALKVISDASAQSDDARGRLLREARAAAALDHPNAVSIFDVGELSGAPYIVMELVSGRTLREVVGDPAVPLATRTAWLADVARALGAAHRRGLVHRDVKPENVMVRDDGVVKVLDFGIARRVTGEGGAVDAGAPTQAPALPTLTREGVKVGTPAYMSPEQIRGDALDGRSDQFVWGVLAFELLTGKLPWRGGGDALSLVASILTDEVPADALAGAGVPPATEAVIRRALSRKPEDRFASMEDLVRALEGSDRDQGTGQRLPPATARRAPPPAALASPSPSPSPAPGRTTALQRYSTEEVQEILARAVEQQEAQRADTRLGFDDLVAAAREVGVAPEVLRQASRDLRARQAAQADEGAARDAWLRRKHRKFYRHLGVWAIVNLALLIVGFLEHHPGDMLKVAAFWGIAVGIHGLRAFTAHEDDWREEREREEKKERKKRRRAESIDRALDQGAAVLLETGAALRRRVEATPPPEPGRVRVAAVETGSSRDLAAEEEAAAVERAPRQQRRR